MAGSSKRDRPNSSSRPPKRRACGISWRKFSDGHDIRRPVLAGDDRLDWRTMSEIDAGTTTAPEVTELAEGLQRTLAKLFSVLRRGDSNVNREAAGELTLAQLSILVTLLETGPIRMTE